MDIHRFTESFVEKKYPAWLLPNLLSLDAPIVAIAWAWMFAQTWRVQWVNNNIFPLLAGVVWLIYVIDRFIDNKVSNGERAKNSARHAFHEKHWKWFKLTIFGVIGFCIATALHLPVAVYFHGIPVLILVSIYFFSAVFTENTSNQPQLFKNAVAGLTFSYGVALGIYFFRPSSYWFQLITRLYSSFLIITESTSLSMPYALWQTRHSLCPLQSFGSIFKLFSL